jgi:hypothetical protein
MKQLPKAIYLILILILTLSSCKKENESSTSLLTSKTWGKPKILHQPGNVGMWTGTTCGEFNNFLTNGVYSRKDECTGYGVEGEWSWTIKGKELFLDFKGALPVINNRRLVIVELSDTLLHTYEMSYNVSDTSGRYWEKKYRPRKN